MPRFVLADHVLFEECLYYLRSDLYNKNQEFQFGEKQPSFSCISTTFEISKPWKLADFTIQPSISISLPASYKSLFSFLENPNWILNKLSTQPHLFGEILSTLVSFVTLTPVKSPRNGYGLEFNDINNIPQHCIDEVALTLPFLAAGPGAHISLLKTDEEDCFILELNELIENLKTISEKNYVIFLQSIRLLQLSLVFKRDDFGLAYLLLISAIEAVAQNNKNSLKVERNIDTRLKESHWQELTKGDPSLEELFAEYKRIRHANDKKALTDIFTDFIFEFAPPEIWENIVISRYDWNEYPYDSSSEFHPSKMQKNDLISIIKKTYAYRSGFVHAGKQPPHTDPQSIYNKFFETIQFSETQDKTIEKLVTPTYELMLGIAKTSISQWLLTLQKY
ncbi:hypothetical protein [Acinetobacter larvae]|uniref:Apea-like HEPN domain-containing protein n=1 Tax=Acinetobacter larvae TaxID=1789224 RepID=A0A1B2LZF5_9GAMM|nr:hypothetical protein [Acinetobacter larvae]AOA58289.1 hypothetical protein BFG52_07905 [Acinetobacter larvae]